MPWEGGREGGREGGKNQWKEGELRGVDVCVDLAEVSGVLYVKGGGLECGVSFDHDGCKCINPHFSCACVCNACMYIVHIHVPVCMLHGYLHFVYGCSKLIKL